MSRVKNIGYEKKLNGDWDVYAIDAVNLRWYNAGTVRLVNTITWRIVWPDGTLSEHTYKKREDAALVLAMGAPGKKQMLRAERC